MGKGVEAERARLCRAWAWARSPASCRRDVMGKGVEDECNLVIF